jgi:hypothetical protein
MRVKRIGIGSAAKLSGAMYGAAGLIFGVIFGVAALIGAGFASQFAADSADAPPAFFGALFGVGAIFLFPLLYGLLGLVIGTITAALYNLFARLVGGLEVDLE